MAYKRDTSYKLRFEEFKDDDGDCLQVRVKPLTVDELLAIQDDELSTEELVKMFATHLVWWNLQGRDGDECADVPATEAGIRSQDALFIVQLINLWADQVVSVPDPLPKTSDDGRPSEELSLPMEPLSPSPSN